MGVVLAKIYSQVADLSFARRPLSMSSPCIHNNNESGQRFGSKMVVWKTQKLVGSVRGRCRHRLSEPGRRGHVSPCLTHPSSILLSIFFSIIELVNDFLRVLVCVEAGIETYHAMNDS
jgi:hypothetical protein